MEINKKNTLYEISTIPDFTGNVNTFFENKNLNTMDYKLTSFTQLGLEDYNFDAWLLEDEYADDEIIVHVEIDHLFDAIMNIYNQTMINDEDNDEHMLAYINACNINVEYVLADIVDNPRSIRFNVMQTFLWIYFVIASRNEKRAIKYLINSPYFSVECITKLNNYNDSCLYNLCRQNDIIGMKPLVDNKLITLQMLLEKSEKMYPPLFYAIVHTDLFVYMLENIQDVQLALNFEINFEEEDISLVHLICQYNGQLLKYLLETEKISENVFNKIYDDTTILMMCSIYNPDVVPYLINHKFMTSKHFNYSSESENVLSLISSYKPELVIDIISSPFCNNETINNKSKYIVLKIVDDEERSKKTYIIDFNFMFNLVHENDVFMKVIKSRIINEQTLKQLLHHQVIEPDLQIDTTLLNYLYYENYLLFNEIVEECIKIIEPSYILQCIRLPKNHDDNKIDKMLCGVIKREHIDINKSLEGLSQKNIIMVALQNGYMALSKWVIKNKQIDYDCMDENGNSVRVYMCVYYPKLFLQTQEYEKLNNEEMKYILCMTQNESILQNISKNYAFDIDLIKEILDKNDKTFLIILQYINESTLSPHILKLLHNAILLQKNTTIIKAILDHSSVTPEIFNTKIKGKYVLLDFIVKSFGKKNNDYYYKLFKIVFNHPKNVNNDYSNTITCNEYTLPMIQLLDKYGIINENNIDTILHINHECNKICFDVNVVTYIVNHKYFNGEKITKLIDKVSKYNAYKSKKFISMLKCILTSTYCNDSHIHSNDTIALIVRDNVNMINTILESPNYSKKIFSTVLNDIYTLKYVIQNDEIMNKVINLEYYDMNDLLFIGDEIHNIMEILFSQGKYILIEKIFDRYINNTTCFIEFLFSKGLAKCSIIHYVFTSHALLKKIIGLNILDSSHLLYKDCDGNNCLHYCASYENIDGFRLLLETGFIKKEHVYDINIDNDNFLTFNGKFVKHIIDSDIVDSKSLEIYNNNGCNVLSYLLRFDPEYAKKFINHEKVTSTIFSHPALIVDIISTIRLGTGEEGLFSYIINHEKFEDKYLISKDNILISLLYNHYILVKQSTGELDISTENAVKLLLESPNDLSHLFSLEESSSTEFCNLFLLINCSDPKIFKLLLESKYINHDTFGKYDSCGHNLLVYIFSKGLEHIKVYMESEYNTPDKKYSQDIDNDTILILCHRQAEILNYLLGKQFIDEKLMTMKNTLGRTIMHYVIRYSESTDVLLNSSFDQSILLREQDIFGNTPVHLACKENIKSITNILNKMDSSLMEIQNNKGKNCLMLIIKYHKILFDKVASANIITYTSLKQLDYKGNTVLSYLCRYYPKGILKIKSFCDDALVKSRNYKYESPLMVACRYNGEAVKYLLELDVVTFDLLNYKHSDMGSGLITACKYQPIAVKYILEWDKLDINRISITNKDGKIFIEYACQYNNKSLKYILDSNHDFTKLLYAHNSFFVACKWNPDALKTLLNSKYNINKLFTKIINDESCLDIALHSQPKALKYLVEHFGDHPFFNVQNYRGYRLINELQETYPEMDNYKEIVDMDITNYDNIVYDNEKNMCYVCMIYKYRVLLSPCNHKLCVGCSFRVKECPQCRSEIEERIVFDKD